MRNYLSILPAMAALLLLFSFLSPPKGKKSIRSIDPPGVVRIDEFLYMDHSEISNFCWLEYLYWNKTVYGSDSKEYRSALPDTTLWKQENEELRTLENDYLRHPAYADYPVVGLTYEQMTAYCKWRSDRVFENLLVRTGRIEWNANQDSLHFFTAEKYFAGNYQNYKPDPAIREIPHYYLPSKQEWLKASSFANQLYADLTSSQRKKGPDAYYKTVADFKGTQPVSPGKKYAIRNALYNLHRNVSEQLSDSLVVAGSNWKNRNVLAEDEYWLTASGPSVTTGFRCAFVWKSVR